MPSNKQREKQTDLEKKIINILKETAQFLPDIYRELKARNKKDYKIIQHVVHELEKKKFIVADRRGMFRTVNRSNSIKGKIIISARGYGFVEKLESDKTEEDIFIPVKYINGALDGDIVEVRIISEDHDVRRKPGKGPVGIVDKILKRKRPKLVGELVVKRSGFYLKALSRKIPDDIRVCGDLGNVKRGDWLNTEIIYDENGSIACRYINKIGKVGNIEDDIDAIVAEYNFNAPYTEEQEKAAEEIKPVEVKRKDLTNLFCVTIDPHDAKDFDDSISVSNGDKDDEIILGVHIADVAAWITPGSWIDKEAKARGFTAYIPGRTLPMLPENLTKNISLRSDKELNFAHTILMVIDKNTGCIKSCKRIYSKIKIAKRLTFSEVENYINSGENSTWGTELKDNIAKLVSLYRIMRNYRKDQEKFLDMETSEIRILRNDSDGKILGIEKKKQGEADCLVEEFMLAANSVIAKEFVNSRIPGIFRIHPEPLPDKLEEFSEFLGEVFNISTGDLASGRKACQNFLKKIKGHKHEEIIVTFFLRAMNRALYSEKYALHYGLGKGLYLHFTSPIRRYPDLIVHQQLLLKEQNKNYLDEEFIKKTALECTELEKNNDEAYFAANDRLKLHYLQDLISKNELEVYEGVISSVNAGGMLADIPSIGLSAYIPIESINGTFNKRYGRLISERKGTEYKPGDFVYLQLEKIDFIKGSAIFKPVQY